MRPPLSFSEPKTKRLMTFVDGQALYRSTKEAFGHTFPNYDVKKLSEKIAAMYGWQLSKMKFYAGVPDMIDDPCWRALWTKELAPSMSPARQA